MDIQKQLLKQLTEITEKNFSTTLDHQDVRAGVNIIYDLLDKKTILKITRIIQEKCACENCKQHNNYLDDSLLLPLQCPKAKVICLESMDKFIRQIIGNHQNRIKWIDEIQTKENICPNCGECGNSSKHWNYQQMYEQNRKFFNSYDRNQITQIYQEEDKFTFSCPTCYYEKSSRKQITFPCGIEQCQDCVASFLESHVISQPMPKNQDELQELCMEHLTRVSDSSSSSSMSSGNDPSNSEISKQEASQKTVHMTFTIAEMCSLKFARKYLRISLNLFTCPKCQISFEDVRQNPVTRFCPVDTCRAEMCQICDGLRHQTYNCPQKLNNLKDDIEAKKEIIKQVTEGNFFICPNCQNVGEKKDQGACERITCSCKAIFAGCCSTNHQVIKDHSLSYHRRGCLLIKQKEESKGDDNFDFEVDQQFIQWEQNCLECQQTPNIPCPLPKSMAEFIEEIQIKMKLPPEEK